jgi:hypothetical protein
VERFLNRSLAGFTDGAAANGTPLSQVLLERLGGSALDAGRWGLRPRVHGRTLRLGLLVQAGPRQGNERAGKACHAGESAKGENLLRREHHI